MNILIVGGTGFIGYHLAKTCLEKGWKVSSISSKKPKKSRFLSQVKYMICDISKEKKLKKKLKYHYDYVVNLGGYVDHINKEKTFNSHYKGCKNLAEIFLKKKIKIFIQMGSSGEYGRKKSPQSENYNGNPKAVYAKSKLRATKYLLNLHKRKKFPVVVLRLYQAYGPHQDINRLIPIVIDNCIKNKKFDCSDGMQFRDFVYIDDLILAIRKCILNRKKILGNILNIGTGKPIKIKNIIEKITNKLKGGYPQFGKIKLRSDEILKIYPDTRKTKKLIKWRASTSFESGLKKTIQFYSSVKNI